MELIYHNQNILLSGLPGLTMRKDAMTLAHKLLEFGGNLNAHPDFMLIEQTAEKKTIGVEVSDAMRKLASLHPAISKHHVIIIDGINYMTVEAQDKILKLLEDASNTIVIAISYEIKDVLPTIISRFAFVEYFPLSYADFCDEIKHTGIDSILLFNMTGGCPGLFEEMKSLVPMFQAVQTAIHDGKRAQLLPAMHLLMEKDKDAITATPYVPQMLGFLQTIFYDELENILRCDDSVYTVIQLKNIIDRLQKDKNICRFPSYSKDNFFQTIVFIIEQ